MTTALRRLKSLTPPQSEDGPRSEIVMGLEKVRLALGEVLTEAHSRLPAETKRELYRLRQTSPNPYYDLRELSAQQPDVVLCAEIHEVYTLLEGVVTREVARGRPINLKLKKTRSTEV